MLGRRFLGSGFSTVPWMPATGHARSKELPMAGFWFFIGRGGLNAKISCQTRSFPFTQGICGWAFVVLLRPPSSFVDFFLPVRDCFYLYLSLRSLTSPPLNYLANLRDASSANPIFDQINKLWKSNFSVIARITWPNLVMNQVLTQYLIKILLTLEWHSRSWVMGHRVDPKLDPRFFYHMNLMVVMNLAKITNQCHVIVFTSRQQATLRSHNQNYPKLSNPHIVYRDCDWKYVT